MRRRAHSAVLPSEDPADCIGLGRVSGLRHFERCSILFRGCHRREVSLLVTNFTDRTHLPSLHLLSADLAVSVVRRYMMPWWLHVVAHVDHHWRWLDEARDHVCAY